ncbi:6cfb3b82-b41d-4f85-924a-995ca8bda9b7 [Thermothielavioides terrestris]|uniref:6cfb3b82-b41d-4f85-924a-995ca8bda9b7 n=1 Tax=Thermothielavioides terrestris TaxID=2587410 RepID=A0A3S4CA43_9PEZI|nr:6cfb3b82-b41d-4f85-924a-995ca8bda9b7 [Thermothielavioides terrestris]
MSPSTIINQVDQFASLTLDEPARYRSVGTQTDAPTPASTPASPSAPNPTPAPRHAILFEGAPTIVTNPAFVPGVSRGLSASRWANPPATASVASINFDSVASIHSNSVANIHFSSVANNHSNSVASNNSSSVASINSRSVASNNSSSVANIHSSRPQCLALGQPARNNANHRDVHHRDIANIHSSSVANVVCFRVSGFRVTRVAGLPSSVRGRQKQHDSGPGSLAPDSLRGSPNNRDESRLRCGRHQRPRCVALGHPAYRHGAAVVDEPADDDKPDEPAAANDPGAANPARAGAGRAQGGQAEAGGSSGMNSWGDQDW